MSGLVATTLAAADGWRYAAWVAVDLRLLLFLVLVSALGATGTCILFVRRRHPLHLAAAFIVSFVALFAALVLIFNGIAHYPVFVVERFFPFP
ncbi:MAG: hypothetical protein ACQEXJ_01660 [Myxococcota bacterium]